MTTTYKNRYTNKALLDDEEINAGGLAAAHLAWALSVLVDDQGRLTASVKWIWKEAYKHLEEVSLVRCRRAFEHLDQAARFVLLYRFEGRDYLMIRNWHRFQPQKVDRVKWSSLPAPPGWVPELYLPKRLLEQWNEDKKDPGFSSPPISIEWISGGRPEPFRFRNGSVAGDIPEDERTQSVSASGTLPTRAPVDVGKSGQSGRSGRSTRGDKDQIGPPATTGPGEADPSLLASTAVHGNGAGGSHVEASDWSDWENLTTGQRQLRLTNWLYGKHGWASVTAKTRDHEATMALHIAELAMDGSALLTHLEAWWDDTDPDDRPSSLEYFWTRLQQVENEGLKQHKRPHVRTSRISKLSESLPDIQSSKP